MSKVLGEQDDVSDGLDQYFPGSTTDEFLALGLSSLAVISNQHEIEVVCRILVDVDYQRFGGVLRGFEFMVHNPWVFRELGLHLLTNFLIGTEVGSEQGNDLVIFIGDLE